jgi:hypothetical protein
MQAFLTEYITQFWTATRPEQLGYLVTVVTIAVAVIGVLGVRNVRQRLKTAEAMVDDLTNRLREKDTALLDQQRQLRQFEPSQWLEEAGDLGDAQLAANRLRLGLDNVRRDLARVAYRLADHHFDRSFARPEELGEASALAQIAAVFDPTNNDVRRLAFEINEARAATHDPLQRYTDDPAWSTWPFPTAPDEARLQIDDLARRAETANGRGQYYLAQRIANLALRVAGAAGLMQSRPASYAMVQLAEALYPVARYQEAYDLTQRILAAPMEAGGQEKNWSHARALQGRILWRTDNPVKAFEVLQRALAEMNTTCSPRCGPKADALLALAQSLSDLGRNTEALEKIDLLIAERPQPDIGEDVRRLGALVQRAQIVGRLNRHAEALDALQEIRPRFAAKHGEGSPHLHWLDHLCANELWELGRKEEARETNARAIAGMERAIGAAHPDTRAFKHLQTQWAAGPAAA